MAEALDEYGVVADYYDFVSPYAERQDLTFFMEMAGQSDGPVLEGPEGDRDERVLLAEVKVPHISFYQPHAALNLLGLSR